MSQFIITIITIITIIVVVVTVIIGMCEVMHIQNGLVFA